MHIGILQCDQLLEELRDSFEELPDMVARGLSGVRPEWTHQIYPCHQGQFPADLKECDAFITTGSRYSVYDPEPWIDQLADLVRAIARQGTPFVGICFGHQMMAHALGGKVEPAEAGWGVGVSTTGWSQTCQWMKDAPETVNLVVSHQDQVTALPQGFENLGGNAFCPISWCLSGGHMLGIQGHPEFTTAYSQALMNIRRERIGEETYQAGIESLKEPVDSEWTFKCIARFIEEASHRLS